MSQYVGATLYIGHPYPKCKSDNDGAKLLECLLCLNNTLHMGELRSVPSFSLNGIIRCDGLCFCATYETPKGPLAVHVLDCVADELMGTKRGHGQASQWMCRQVLHIHCYSLMPQTHTIG